MKISLDKIKKIKKPEIGKPNFSKLKKINVRKLNTTTLLAVLSYLHVLAIIPFVASKDKPFVRFHVKQGIVLLAFFALFFFTLYIPVIPYIVALFYVACILFGIVNVFRGGEKHLPVIGKLADRL